jgi:hypothetical protein
MDTEIAGYTGPLKHQKCRGLVCTIRVMQFSLSVAA